ncbi:MAG: hypothetical protein QNJ97_22000 [Myxococcota bacterium]|nr:hypothetical protein [Myxococcota bacterium]
MPYKGPDRRIHAVFSTRNRQYHVRSGVCIAVRDKKTGVWISLSEAIGMLLEQRPSMFDYLGHPLRFFSQSQEVLTTRVEDVFRPERTIVDVYDIVWSVSPIRRMPKINNMTPPSGPVLDVPKASQKLAVV